MLPQPLIAVRDVEKSSRWYQKLLGCQSGHGGDLYEQLMAGDRMVMQLHKWGDHAHPNLGDPDTAPHGYGVLLWFETDRFDDTLSRARELGAEVIEEPHVNPNAKHREVWIRDPDGYVVVLASPYGDTGP